MCNCSMRGLNYEGTILLRFPGHTGVLGRGIRTGMPQNMLQSTEVQAKLQQMGSVAMPQSMHMDPLGNTGVLAARRMVV